MEKSARVIGVSFETMDFVDQMSKGDENDQGFKLNLSSIQNWNVFNNRFSLHG